LTEKINPEKNRTVYELNREKVQTASLSVLSNSVLVASKLVIGLMIGSVSVISEAIHSGIDLVASAVAYVSVRKSSQPPDAEHYYGHGKFEDISGAVEAILILLASFLIVREAYLKLVSGVEVADVSLGIAVMTASCIVNFFISQRLFRAARRTESIALEADAWHLQTDVFTSLGILIGLILIKFTGIKIIDPIMAIVVAIIILKAAIDLIRKSVRDLVDVSLPASEEKEIKEIIQKYSGNYFEFHAMRTRRSGSDRFIDFHLVVCQNVNIQQAHDLADKMEKQIMQEIPRSSIIIHLEPCENLNECDSCGKTIKPSG
jgi:cation diffusion facilitator family transporter